VVATSSGTNFGATSLDIATPFTISIPPTTIY
jgi:hypothetical protein